MKYRAKTITAIKGTEKTFTILSVDHFFEIDFGINSVFQKKKNYITLSIIEL